MNLDLTEKRAVVCGSTQGIGKAVALELASLRASVTLIARNEEVLKQVQKELPAGKGQKHGYICVDFSYPAQLKEKISSFTIQNPLIHILVNNTGGPPPGAAIEANPDDFVAAFSNHIVCNQILVQALVPGMKSEKYGRIINIISTSVKQPIKNLGVSNTIRGAVANWSKTLAGELAPFGITVNNILPGSTDTNRLCSLMEWKAKKQGKSFEKIKQEMISEIPAGRLGEASEIAYAVAFLASPAASYITGINLPVDGGRTSCL